MMNEQVTLNQVGKFYRDLDLSWRAWLRRPGDPTLLEVLAAHAGRLGAFSDEARIDRLSECVQRFFDQIHAIETQGSRPSSSQMKALRGAMAEVLELLQSSPTVAMAPKQE